MKVSFWTVLAVLLAALAVGSFASAGPGAGGPSDVGDLVVTAVLAVGAWASWKMRRRR
ncbi:hypothetical protein [Streptomyces liangshanensis]|uniref:LPXTG cell wall anchor domain-containing protein n=1 Tax=Streptomyces liangshanensis TaxID=2717324 RepID=A0A6G9H7R0_9ACTN|nr:hypothetical protein [Streptomyces liangshanensis]QIQ06137.1 hypothetical protein HA039_30910 [Streptomyces liangshanensis]